jgi:pimeloyl-ACP methyl ester carboxylesterase
MVLCEGQAEVGESGHEVFAPSLTGLAEHSHLLSPSIDLDTHIHDVVQLIYYWDLEDVILVGHSYGGMVITGIADKVTDRIDKIVYLDAANPRNGQSLVDVAGPIIEAVRPWAWSSMMSNSSFCPHPALERSME